MKCTIFVDSNCLLFQMFPLCMKLVRVQWNTRVFASGKSIKLDASVVTDETHTNWSNRSIERWTTSARLHWLRNDNKYKDTSVHSKVQLCWKWIGLYSRVTEIWIIVFDENILSYLVSIAKMNSYIFHIKQRQRQRHIKYIRRDIQKYRCPVNFLCQSKNPTESIPSVLLLKLKKGQLILVCLLSCLYVHLNSFRNNWCIFLLQPLVVATAGGLMRWTSSI